MTGVPIRREFGVQMSIYQEEGVGTRKKVQRAKRPGQPSERINSGGASPASQPWHMFLPFKQRGYSL